MMMTPICGATAAPRGTVASPRATDLRPPPSFSVFPFPCHEELPSGKEKQHHADGVFSGHHPECGRIAPVLCHDTAEQAAKSESEVPSREDARVCRAALVVPCYGHEHVEEGRVEVSVAQAYHQCRQIVGHGMWHGDKKYKSHEREAHAFRGVVCHLALPQRLLPLQAREEEAGRQNGEIGARAPGYAKGLLAVYRQVVAQRAPAKPEHGDVYGQQPRPGEEESVERYLALVSYYLFLRQVHGAGNHHRQSCHAERNPEQRAITSHAVVQPYPHRRRYGHREVVAQSVEANALVASRRRQHVYRARAVCHSHRPERRAVYGAAYGEHEQRAGGYVSGEAHEKQRQADHEHLFP